MMADDWRPIASAASLEQRAAIIWRIRDFFHRHGFSEVHTPTISRDSVVDRYIDPIVVEGAALACADASAAQYYLQTSPEFCMKRLLAAGMTAIYQLGPAYRASERGRFHNPEFTMLEWYRVGETFAQSVAFVAHLANELLSGFAPAAQSTQTLTYQQAFQNVLALDPLSCSDDELIDAARHHSLSLGSSWHDQSRDDWLNLLFADIMQPLLGTVGPTVLTHYPASQAALAQVSEEDPRTAERYELFWKGVELANGYHELLSASELRVRSERVLRLRRSDGKPDLPIDNRLLTAMQAGLPDSCGCALGVDRLVMVCLGAEVIDEVIAFPIERA